MKTLFEVIGVLLQGGMQVGLFCLVGWVLSRCVQ
jgi:hypothetical protein